MKILDNIQNIIRLEIIQYFSLEILKNNKKDI